MSAIRRLVSFLFDVADVVIHSRICTGMHDKEHLNMIPNVLTMYTLKQFCECKNIIQLNTFIVQSHTLYRHHGYTIISKA